MLIQDELRVAYRMDSAYNYHYHHDRHCSIAVVCSPRLVSVLTKASIPQDLQTSKHCVSHCVAAQLDDKQNQRSSLTTILITDNHKLPSISRGIAGHLQSPYAWRVFGARTNGEGSVMKLFNCAADLRRARTAAVLPG